jgi:biopolymer transport protein ExbD
MLIFHIMQIISNRFRFLPASSMKMLLLLFALFSLPAFGQSSGETKLYTPRNSGDDLPTDADYRHSIEMMKEHVLVRINGNKTELPYGSLSTFISKHKKEVQAHLLTLIVHDDAGYGKTVEVLDALSDNKIRKFKMLSAPREEHYVEPTVTSKVLVYDSSYFTVRIGASGCLVSFKNDTTRFSGCAELQPYIAKRKPEIESGKILIIGPGNLPAEKASCYLRAFTINGIYKFKLLTEPVQ